MCETAGEGMVVRVTLEASGEVTKGPGPAVPEEEVQEEAEE